MMNRTVRVVVITLVIFAVHAQAALKMTDLRCEYLNNPLGLDTAHPRLSWQEQSADRGARQTARRILVASTAALLDQNTGDLWDTGKIDGGDSIQIEYAGKPLVSGQECFWKVQAWDQNGEPSAWSAPASWTMGLLDPSDWKAKWIGQASFAGDTQLKEPPPAPMLRKTFTLDKPIAKATAYVCSLGYHELYLNGAKVGDHLLDPPLTQFNKRALYVTYDVTQQLTAGKNAVGMILGSSWYDSVPRDAWNFYRAAWRALPQAMLRIDVQYRDGSHAQVVTDASWKIGTGPILYDQTRVGEVYDARLEKPGWASTDFDDTAWGAAAEREGGPAMVSASAVQPIKVIATIKPVKITQPRPGVYVFDTGQNLAGLPRLKVNAPVGTKIHLKCGELLNKDGTVDASNINSLVKSPEVQCDTYICKGVPGETYEPRFCYHGFQYVEVTGLPAAPDETTLVADVVQTSFDSAGSFECSDDTFNKIEHGAIWAYRSNFVGIPTDCPHREKNGWTGDAQLAVAMGLEHFHGEAAYTQWIQTLEDCMRDDGKLPCIAPSTAWGYNRLDGPAWESAYLLVPWQVYLQCGDKRILTSHYPGFKKWIDWYTRKSPGHIVTYGLGDWAPVKTQSPSAVTSTGYYYRDLLIIAETARLLGNDAEAKQYTDLAEQTRQAFNDKFFDAKTGQYGGGTQTCLACALYQGMVNDPDHARVVQNLVDAVEKNNDHIDTGILGAKYLLRALSDNGHVDIAWKIASQHDQPSWGNWTDRGATTLWEEWDGTSSRNHIMFGDISSWFVEYLAGIRPDPAGPGYQKIFIHPLFPGDLTQAKATRDSLYGVISSSWEKKGQAVVLKLVIPPNTGATVWIPATKPQEINESGKPVSDARGVKFLRTDGGDTLYSVEAGSYEFSFNTK